MADTSDKRCFTETIKDYPGYIISKDGRVISLFNNKILNPRTNEKGYFRVSLVNENGKKDFYIHRLVAQTFLVNPENKRTVNHKNGCKEDNTIENLEWMTYSENHKHSYRELGRKVSWICIKDLSKEKVSRWKH